MGNALASANRQGYASNDFFLFWSGPFSQWAKYDIILDGVTFNTCEQYMMAEKAKLFNDSETFKLIMSTSNPERQKKLGRLVQGFDKAVWDDKARDIVYRANLAKFGQHVSLSKLLSDTGDRVIVEASPLDRVWGIGLDKKSPDAINPERWRGTNWLGFAIQRARMQLLGINAKFRLPNDGMGS